MDVQRAFRANLILDPTSSCPLIQLMERQGRCAGSPQLIRLLGTKIPDKMVPDMGDGELVEATGKREIGNPWPSEK